MAHNWKCATAKLPGCVCACGGARHGCQGAFKIASGSFEGVLLYMRQREADWKASPAKLTYGQAAIGCAQADVVHWLHRDHELLDCARAAQTTTFEDDPDVPDRGMVLRQVIRDLGPDRMDSFQGWAATTHFWCELLAQMAYALTQYEEIRGQIFRMVEDVIGQWGERTLPHGLQHTWAIGSAVNWTWRYLLASIVRTAGAGSLAALLASGDVGRLLWPIRVVAVLMCPDASNHPAVRKYCWEPIVNLAEAEVRGAVRERLTQVFTKDPWFAPRDDLPREG
ncbi:hypothetical protein [Actinomadura fibrosa]|uniref:Uncharacterized protein n=1 Tax=Actinomadura fibrosa TaxID=111802 RepID=A0ABW2Y5V6_9ACTN|nr:hypothetical protein [Actinomadura fibrosa]